jgi:hypothetical protein
MLPKRWLLINLTWVVLSVVAQQTEVCLSFKDKSSGMYGFKDKASGDIIIPAQYEKVSCSSGQLFPVFKDGYWFVVNTSNQPVTPINKMKDQIIYHKGRFDSVPQLYGYTSYFNDILGKYGAAYYQYYRINEQCDCIPVEGMLCPFFVAIDTTQTPEYLKLLQRAYVARTKDYDAPLAYKLWHKARSLAPNNAFVEYFMATLVYDGYQFDNYAYNFNPKKYGHLYQVVDSLKETKSTDHEVNKKLNLLQWHMANSDKDKKWQMEEYFWEFQISDSIEKLYDLAMEKEKKTNGETPFYWQIRGARFNSYQDDFGRKELKAEFKELRHSPYRKELGGEIIDATIGAKGFVQNGFQGWGLAAQVSLMNFSALGYSIHYGIGYDRFIKENTTSNAINLDFHTVNLSYFFGDMGKSIGVRPTIPLSFWRIQLEYGYQFMFGANNRDLRGHHLGVKMSIPYYTVNRYVKSFYYFNSTFF